jgi:hypothetical protein
MDEKIFKERVLRLKKIGKVLEELPSEIRALAFPIISDYAMTGLTQGGETARGRKANVLDEAKIPPPMDREGFFKEFDHGKPADNAKLLAAWFYKEYGTEPFSYDEIRELAKNVGVTVPGRIDMTFSAATENGKKLFTHAGQGKLIPTVHGEAYLKETYRILKGTKQRPAKIK